MNDIPIIRKKRMLCAIMCRDKIGKYKSDFWINEWNEKWNVFRETDKLYYLLTK